jgi:putative transcriptional regulator
MRILRDKSLSTQVLILYELYRGSYSKLEPLADKIGVTQQAVSEYLKKMREEDLIQKTNRQYKPTIKGISLLQQEILSLKNFTDECIQNLYLISTSVAISDSTIKRGETVYLRMEDGWLTASTHKTSSSTGVSLHHAGTGDLVAVTCLKGLLKHTTGRINFFSLPDPFMKDYSSLDIYPKVRKQLERQSVDVIIVIDAAGKVTCKKIGVKPDVEYGGVYAAIDAAQRGLNVAVIGYKQDVDQAVSHLKTFNEKTIQPLNYDIFNY